MRNFDNQAKQYAFDLLANRFYEHNFGQISKADFEVLMFKIYLDDLHRSNEDDSDFVLATALGITESKVRSLKVKKELQYPDNGIGWKSTFIRSIQYAAYDEKNDLVKLAVVDPNVKRNLDHSIDELHIYSEAQLNGKLLQMRPDHFIRLIESLSNDLGNNGFDRKKLVTQIKDSTVANTFASAGILQRLEAGEAVKDLIQDILKASGKTGIRLLLSSVPFGNVLQECVDFFLEKL